MAETRELHSIPVAVCWLHGGREPRFTCQACIRAFESDRDHDALDEEF